MLNQTAEAKAQSSWQIQLLTLALSAWTAWLALYWPSMLVCAPANNDQSWYLYAAHLILSGAQPYGPRIVETNPPLILWFSTTPVSVAHLLHLNPYLGLKLIVFAMIVGSVAWSRRVLHSTGMARLPIVHRYLVVGSVLTAEIYLGWLEFGQREHLLVILILPYIFSAAFNGKSKLSSAELCALGAAAGFAVCFKPQQVLILVALELFLAAWTRSLKRLTSPDFVCAVLAVFAYIIAVHLWAPLYFSKMIPILRKTYWAYGSASAWTLIKTEPIFNFLSILVLGILIWRRRKLRFSQAIGAFLACSFASSITYCSQHIGYLLNYRAYPQHAFLLLAIIWVAIDLFPPHLAVQWKFDSTFMGATLVFALILFAALFALNNVSTGETFPATVFAKYPPNTPVFTFSTNLSDGFPAVLQDHLIWASRFPTLWMVPAIVQNEKAQIGGPVAGKSLPPSVVRELATKQRAETTEDIRQWKPRVVVVRQCHRFSNCVGMDNLDFDPLKWFMRSPKFAAEWSNYRYQTSNGDYDVYTRVQ